MDDEDESEFLPPANLNIFGIPNEPELLREYELYRTSKGTRRLHSERNREVYAEASIENERLGTLANLCVRALAKMGTRYIAPPVKQDPLKFRIHYDALDVNLPLKDCYFVDDVRFWRRVVLAKSSDKCLSLKKLDEYDWKGQGISLKYVELVESCPAAYWPEKEMAELGYMVRQYVRTMHIRHLQSLTENAFMHYVESESELDVTSAESILSEISSDERDTADDEEVEEEEKVEAEEEEESVMQTSKTKLRLGVSLAPKAVHVESRVTSSSFHKKPSRTVIHIRDAFQDDFQAKRREARAARNAARQQLRNLQQEKREEHERRNQSRELRRQPPEPAPKRKKKKKKKPQKAIDGVFDLAVDPEPDDGVDKIADGRNKEKLLRRIKRYDYPAKHCHHIDLSFVRYFDRLASLTIEFLGPKMELEYHKRHLNFSYDDMIHLAKGLRTLEQLRVFRLRNSCMDQTKMLILVRVLKQLDNLEIVDFGYDQLNDNCAIALEMLLERRTMLKGLELEYNKLERGALEAIGHALKYQALQEPEGKPLEYLGLSHNPIGEYGLYLLVHDIVGTHHVWELNINGAMAEPGRIAGVISFLLRNHRPLHGLDMAAIKLNPHVGREVICGLQTNHKVTHIDCRACDLDTDEEFEADLIVRRNNYEKQHPYLGDETQTENSLLDYLAGLKHPIKAKIQDQQSKWEECIKNRLPESSTEEIVVEEVKEEQEEEELDIWTVLGAKKSEAQPVPEIYSRSSSHMSNQTFIYNTSAFTAEEFREHLFLPGPGNRHYYFQKQKEM
ncbi:uncharacterized protein LOC6567135 [Drosophila grimshawi]|uniref:GH13032 n=1 Tax=Drosophila grimshawi TaxID=7222 RepID=B4JR94_DROGR|nr:uncharacterized protein LOC6567135 [Drosophila grimshawi]EDV99424.1 GH13032 [Drosophila grimshawi]